MTDVIDIPTTALATRDRSSILLMPVMDIPTALARLQEFQGFIAQYLQQSADGGQDGGDYGIIPGTKKKTLLKSGAEKLCEIYGLADEYVMLKEIEQWDTGLFAYTLKCILKSRRDDSVVGEGLGSCSTYETKYRWRDAQRVCPQCQMSAIIKGRAEYGGGWVCFGKKGGCGAKFADDDPVITKQTIGRIDNPDIIDQRNTALKMAKKRAKIDAVIGVTRSSGIFTQDLEDLSAEAPSKPSAREPAKAPQNSPGVSTSAPTDTRNDAIISPAQGKKLWAVARRHGWDEPALRAWLIDLWNCDSIHKVKRQNFDTILEQLARPKTEVPA